MLSLFLPLFLVFLLIGVPVFFAMLAAPGLLLCTLVIVVMLQHACMVNGFDDLSITNLDGLDQLDTIKICVAYRLNGKKIQHMPSSHLDLEACEPVYETFKGWKKSTEKCQKWSDLPLRARRYLKAIHSKTGVKISSVSVGPDRKQTIQL